MINRRSIITGLISFVAAPAIVRASNLMPVKVMEPLPFPPFNPAYMLDVLYGKMEIPSNLYYINADAFYMCQSVDDKLTIVNINDVYEVK